MKKAFTTGECAKLCLCSVHKIINLVDSGEIKGFRVPGSRYRRIRRAEVIATMRKCGLDHEADELEAEHEEE